MMLHGSIRVVRRWRGLRGDPICRCFDDPKGLNNGYLSSGHGPQVHKLANGLRLSTVVPSQDLSGACVTVHGCESARVNVSP
jgi:hypothetical protein